MMGTVTKILSGTAILIGMYLFLSHSSETVKIVSGISSAYTGGIKTLQGR